MNCNKCGQKMQFNDGCVMGAYGVDYENCADPVYVCRCGNVVDATEPEPPTTSNSEYITPTSWAERHPFVAVMEMCDENNLWGGV